ncbi:MAG: lytic transglycosylase domain-containing protein [Deltaproteobacteria bacterium]|nr:lytic transglycosylase domain-containing protein [Deltaproteobacteria bacterium]
MRCLPVVTAVLSLALAAAAGDVEASIQGKGRSRSAATVVRRTPPPRPPAVFPRVVREDFVRRLAEKVPPIAVLEPVPDYRPQCCFAGTAASTCRSDDANAMCWQDAGDGCGPRELEDGLVAYWPEEAPVAGASPRWGEVTREDQHRAIREILRVLAERQPAKPVGLVAFAVGYVESGFNPTAEHPRTKACGLYQFLRGTWRDYARADVADDPDACRDPRENAATGLAFLTHLYDTHLGTIVEQTPSWDTLSEWDRLTAIFVGLYSLHNYGPNDPRWLDEENGARQIALAHVGVLKEFYEGIAGELRRGAAPARAAKRRR